jgi:hypothetical protein
MTNIINASTIGPVRIFVKRRRGGFTWRAEIAIIPVP